MKKKMLCITVFMTMTLLAGCGKSEAVKNAEVLICNIGPIVNEDSKSDIDSAEAAFEALSEEEKAKVKDSDKLEYYSAVEDNIQKTIQFNEQVEKYNSAAEEVNTVNTEFISYIEEIADSGIYNEKAYDPETITNLRRITADAEVDMEEDIELKAPIEIVNGEDISEAKTDEITQKMEEVIGKTSQIEQEEELLNTETEKITVPDYSEVKEEIKKKWNKAKKSVAIQKQITAPKEAFVISRLLELEGISDVQPATEDNDPNGNLHKKGGYTAQVFFRVPTITDVYGDSTIDIGTDGGGSVEVYETEEYANKRDEYLAGFDGSWIAAGSHYVLGTMIIRTSDNFTATEQREWEAKIIEIMTELRD